MLFGDCQPSVHRVHRPIWMFEHELVSGEIVDYAQQRRIVLAEGNLGSFESFRIELARLFEFGSFMQAESKIGHRGEHDILLRFRVGLNDHQHAAMQIDRLLPLVITGKRDSPGAHQRGAFRWCQKGVLAIDRKHRFNGADIGWVALFLEHESADQTRSAKHMGSVSGGIVGLRA